MIELTQITSIEDRHTSGAYSKRPLTLVRGDGCTVWDDDDNTYLDLASGIGVAVLGHNHPALVQAISEQAATLITAPELAYNDRRADLYELLAEITPFDRFFLCNSGTEATEGALKVARLITQRDGIVATKRAFHGRTIGALSTTWDVKYRGMFGEWLPEVTHISYNDLDSAEDAITDETAAVLVEAIQGEGGIHPASAEFMAGLRELCDETGTLLIVDEVQAGMGRTGKWFAYQHAGIEPDIVTMGKGIAGGVPMGAVLWNDHLGTIPIGSHGSTFGGNPLACAAAIATMTTIHEDSLIERAGELGDWFKNALIEMDHPYVREVRGAGLMIGIELRGRVTPVLKGLQDRGVIALSAGKNVLRLLPPLIITHEELETALRAIREALTDARN